MMDDGSGSDISIASFLIFKPDADKIKMHLRESGPVVATMEFGLPITPGEKIEYELWTRPNDPVSEQFISDFMYISHALKDRATFRPHLYLMDGGQTLIPSDKTRDTVCTNEGRYCVWNQNQKGISGADMVKEGLRRACIWQDHLEESTRGLEWWEYVSEFSQLCSSAEKFSSELCAERAMRVAGIDVDRVKECMRNSGGLEGGSNAILDSELTSSRNVVVLPQMVVNGHVLKGRMSAKNVFSAICDSFRPSDAPEICAVCSTCENVKECVGVGSCLYPATVVRQSNEGGVSGGTFGLSMIFLIGAFAGVGYWYSKKARTAMRGEVRDLVAEYMPLEDQGDQP